MSRPTFDGSQQRAELRLAPGAGDLRALPPEAWREALAAAGVRILSEIEQGRTRAALLSESSLIIQPERAIIITCGEGRLARAVELLLARAPSPPAFVTLACEPSSQSGDWRALFASEVERMSVRFGTAAARQDTGARGEVARWGAARHLERPATEIRFAAIAPAAGHPLGAGPSNPEPFLPPLPHGALADGHRFAPCGYSLNALLADRYLALHISPQPGVALATLETDWPEAPLEQFVRDLTGVLRPARIDRYAGAAGAA